LLLWVADTFLFYLFSIFKGVSEWVAKFFPEEVAKKVAESLTKLYNFVAAHVGFLPIVLLFIVPVFGWLLALWLLLDKTKKTELVTFQATPPQTNNSEELITDYVKGLFGINPSTGEKK